MKRAVWVRRWCKRCGELYWTKYHQGSVCPLCDNGRTNSALKLSGRPDKVMTRREVKLSI